MRQERPTSTPRGRRTTSSRLLDSWRCARSISSPRTVTEHSAGTSRRSSGHVRRSLRGFFLSTRTVGEMRRLGGGGGDELARQQQQQQQTPEGRI